MSAQALVRKVVQRLWRSASPATRNRLLAYLLDDIGEVDKLHFGLPTMEGALRNAKANGFAPRSIVDIGANIGAWSRMAASVFPDAALLLIDGNPEMAEALQRAERDLGTKASSAIVVLGPEAKDQVTFYTVGPGSGVLPELTTFEKGRLTVPMATLDGVVHTRRQHASNQIIGPLLMKLDVQGYELEVLRGGRGTLDEAECVILETSILPYNDGSASFGEVISFMDTAGFVVYDFCGQFRRESDLALVQTDVMFVRPDSGLRKPKPFWRHEPAR